MRQAMRLIVTSAMENCETVAKTTTIIIRRVLNSGHYERGIMPLILPPLKVDQLKGDYVRDKSWRSQLKDDRWKDRLEDLLERVPDSISPNTHMMICGFIERLLEDRQG